MHFSKFIILSLIGSASLLLSGCKKEHVVSARVPAAQEAATKAAETVAKVQPDDTLSLQRALFDARSQASKFNAAGDYEAVDSFDSQFKRELQRLAPELSKSIFPPTQQQGK